MEVSYRDLEWRSLAGILPQRSLAEILLGVHGRELEQRSCFRDRRDLVQRSLLETDLFKRFCAEISFGYLCRGLRSLTGILTRDVLRKRPPIETLRRDLV